MSGYVLMPVVVAALAGLAVAGGLIVRHTDHEWVFLVVLLAGSAALCAAGFSIAGPWARAVADTSCDRYADRTGRETRFVEFAYLSWACLTPAADGRWVSIDQLREVPR